MCEYCKHPLQYHKEISIEKMNSARFLKKMKNITEIDMQERIKDFWK